MKKENIKNFCEKNNLTEKQFYGKETVGGSLDLEGLTSIPEGFNPTVGGSLDLNGLTSNKKNISPDYIFSWESGKYIIRDGILCEVLNKRKNVYKIKIVGNFNESYLIIEGNYSAHADTLKKAKSDLQFKIISEKLKKEPITKDTLLTVKYYRLITGACRSGCENWMKQNNIPYKIDGDDIIELNPITAKELLPILERSSAYGLETFKKLITF
jgi:hypothetical protein